MQRNIAGKAKLLVPQPLIGLHGAVRRFPPRRKQMAVERGMLTFSAPAAYSEGICCEVSC